MSTPRLFDVHGTINAGSTTGVVVLAVAGELGWIACYNAGGAARWVKVYNKATTPTGADTPAMRFLLPAGGGLNLKLEADFSAGISYRVVTGAADSDNTAAGANEVVVNMGTRRKFQ